MPINDNAYHPLVLGADTSEVQATGVSAIAQGIGYGIPGAVTSGLLSIVNTGRDYVGMDQIDTSETLRKLDSMTGLNTAGYYEAHSEGVDAAGFLVGSVGVGGLGVKALKLARSGEAAGAVTRYLGFANDKRSRYLKEALAELGNTGGVSSRALTAAKYKQLGWNVAENVLQSAAAEVAIVATMHDSPLFEKADAADFVSGMLTGALFGGALGGAVDQFAMRGIMKSAATKVQQGMREFDVLFTGSKVGLEKADEAAVLAREILTLKDDFYNTNFTFKFDGKESTLVLDTGAAFSRARSAAEKRGLEQLQLGFNKLANGDEMIGQAYFKVTADLIKRGQAAGMKGDDIFEDVLGFVGSVRSVSSVNEARYEGLKLFGKLKGNEVTDGAVSQIQGFGVENSRIFYINRIAGDENSVFSGSRNAHTSTTAYALVDDVTPDQLVKVRIGQGEKYKSAAEAFKALRDVDYVVNVDNYTAVVNPKSTRVRTTYDPATRDFQYMDLERGAFTDEPVAVLADFQTKKSRIEIDVERNRVRAGKKEVIVDPKASINIGDDAVVNTARHLWASKLKASHFKEVIPSDDFSRLDRAAELFEELGTKFSVKIQDKFTDEIIEVNMDNMHKMREIVADYKLRHLEDFMGKVSGPDVRRLAAALNVSSSWIEEAIGSQFKLTKTLQGSVQKLEANYALKTLQVKMDSSLKQVLTRSGLDPVVGELAKKATNFPAIAKRFGVTLYPWEDGVRNALKIRGVKLDKAGKVVDDPDNMALAAEVVQSVKRALGFADIDGSITLRTNPRAYSHMPVEYVLAHELGHAIDLISRANNTFTTLIPDRKVLSELTSASKVYRESLWRSQDMGYIQYRKSAPELIADGMAAYMMMPMMRNSMKETREWLLQRGVDLKRLEKLFAQETWKASSGATHVADMMLGFEYRTMTQLRAAENAAKSVLGEDAAKLMAVGDDVIKEVTAAGAGAGTFGASNASYGERAKLLVQDLGKTVASIGKSWSESAIGELTPAVNRIRTDVKAAAELGVLTTALRRDPNKYRLVSLAGEDGVEIHQLVDKRAIKMVEDGQAESIEEAVDYLISQGSKGTYTIESDAVAEFFSASTKINATRVNKNTVLRSARGIANRVDPEDIYVPPVDTTRFQHFAFVRAKDRIGNESGLSMIVAKSAEELRREVAKVPEDFEIIYKDGTKRYFEIKGEYDYSLQLNEAKVNSELQRRGVLGDFYPTTRAENVLEEYLRWHKGAEENLVRSAVQTHYAKFFDQLEFLSQGFKETETSTFSGVSRVLNRRIPNPYEDFKKTALNISKQAEYPLLDSLNEFVDKIGTKAYEKIDEIWARPNNLLDYREVNRIMKEAGLGNPYESWEDYITSNARAPRNLVRESVQKMNAFLATFSLRLDFVNSLVNIISTPIMIGTEVASIKKLAADDSEVVGALREIMNVKVPGQDLAVPSTTKMIGNAINAFFGPEGKNLIARYRDNGDIKDATTLFMDVMDDIRLPAMNSAVQPTTKIGKAGQAVSGTFASWSARVDKAIETGAKITGNMFSEDLTRFVSANVMQQMTDPLVKAGKLSIQEQNAYISSFVNRTQGNYLYSQRPVLFQGTTGAAISLFQTYSFNVMQQLLRHVEDQNAKALLTFAGLQTGIYGMNGLPFFDAINTHLIGKNTEGHKDAYSMAPAFNKELGDWLLYGTASAFPLFGEKSPALYTRGDINPRHVSIIPVNPLDVPAVAASIKLVNTVYDFGKKVSNGGDFGYAMLQALEHHGINRPLAGFAQTVAGQSTTSRGALISSANDLETTSWLAKLYSRATDFGGVSRILGAKPMDESIAVNALYRNAAYQNMDRNNLEYLGAAVKTKLYAGEAPTDAEYEEFMERYATSGGDIRNFRAAVVNWAKDANVSVVNQLAEKHASPFGQRMGEIMGSINLNDTHGWQQQADQSGISGTPE